MKNKKLLSLLGVAALLLAGNFAIKEVSDVKTVDAGTIVKGSSHIYFQKPSDWSSSKVLMMLDHDSYSNGYEMKQVGNTSLYYVNISGWGDSSHFCFFNTSSV